MAIEYRYVYHKSCETPRSSRPQRSQGSSSVAHWTLTLSRYCLLFIYLLFINPLSVLNFISPSRLSAACERLEPDMRDPTHCRSHLNLPTPAVELLWRQDRKGYAYRSRLVLLQRSGEPSERLLLLFIIARLRPLLSQLP